jgi:hypothetical protein
MENTSQYLRKEVEGVEVKIDVAKALVLKDLGIDLYKEEGCDTAIEREIREIQEEDEDEDDYEVYNHDTGNNQLASVK